MPPAAPQTVPTGQPRRRAIAVICHECDWAGAARVYQSQRKKAKGFATSLALGHQRDTGHVLYTTAWTHI